jgi:bifunctional UDP-N-acetylglucosamine pyrophosphorylase/glucosamine-1-phosphate N-acetyltransferase
MKAILPVAGNGTRMAPLGVTTPKALMAVLNKPIIVWSLQHLAQGGVDEVIVVTSAGTFGNLIKEFLETKAKSYPGLEHLKITIAFQEQQLGTAHVVQMAKDYFQPGEEFIFIYGDDLYGPESIATIINHPGLAVMGKKVSDPEKWGIFQADEAGNLAKVVEKPSEFVGDLANIGCMKLNTRIFELFDQITISPRGEYELTDSLQLLAEEAAVAVLPTPDYWIPVGYPWHLLEATEYFLQDLQSNIQGTVEDGVVIHGSVVLPASSTIKSGTVIEGNVMFGENVTVGPNAYVRGLTTIGDNSKIGFSVEIKNSVIGENCMIPHLTYVGDSVLGKNINIGAGSVLTNLRNDKDLVQTVIKETLISTNRQKFGAVIGDNARISSNTTIYPGRKIWPDRTTKPGQIITKDITT